MTPRIKPAHSVILSNGLNHFFWDYADGDARPILGLPTQADLETLRLCDSGWWLEAWRAAHGTLEKVEFLQGLINSPQPLIPTISQVHILHSVYV